MTLDPLLAAPPVIQAHVLAALLALALGPVALYRRRRDRWHRRAGRAWVAAMAAAAATGLAIPSEVLPLVAGIGPVHALSLLVFVSLWRGVAAIRAGRVAEHAAILRALYWTALVLAGLFTLLPGRRMNLALFPDRPELGFAAILIGLGLLAWRAWGPKIPLPFAGRLR